MAVLKAGADGGHERLQQLSLLQLAQETQGGAADELVWVLQVLKHTITQTQTKDSQQRTPGNTYLSPPKGRITTLLN